MKIKQLSVFLEDKKGQLCDACERLGRQGINIRALNITETPDCAILRMIVDQPAAAHNVLQDAGHMVHEADVVVVEVRDRPGGLGHILRLLNHAEVDVEYMYGFFEKAPDRALLVFRFDRIDDALAVFSRQGIRTVGAAELGV